MCVSKPSRRMISGVAVLFASLVMAPTAIAQEGYKPTPQNLKARAWFQDAKFGMFIKGGLVLKVPEPQPDEADCVIVLELEAAK